MKAIIYAGIGLFSVATAYGVVDYYGSQKDGTIKKLYVDEEKPAAAEVVETKTAPLPVNSTEPVAAENKTATVKTTKKVKKTSKSINLKNFSRARIPEEVVPEKTIEEKPVPKKAVVLPAEVDQKSALPAKKDNEQ